MNNQYAPNINNFIQRNIIQKQTEYFFISQKFQWHLTANFNRTTTHNNGRNKLKEWAKYVDRKFHGRRFYTKPPEERMFFAAVPEVGGTSGNLHYHLLVRLPLRFTGDFAEFAELTWKKLNTTGSLFVQRITETQDDLIRVVKYDLKDIWKGGGYEQMIFSTEFNQSTER